MNYELLQRHGLTNIEYEPIGTEPSHGDAGISYFSRTPKIYTLRLELDAEGLDRLERALNLLEEEEIKAVDGQGPYGISGWDVTCCDEDVHEVGDCYEGSDEEAAPKIWRLDEDDEDADCKKESCDDDCLGEDDDCSNEVEEPMPAHYKFTAHYKYVLKYR